MTKVYFAKQDKPEKARLLCQIAEDFFQLAGSRILIYLSEEEQALALDRFLWTWDKGSFLPHSIDNGAVDSHVDPIVITSRENNCNGAQILIMGNPCSLAFIKHFQKVVDLAALYDDDLAAQSRERFRSYREQGFNPEIYPS